jgi:hypothetical protein
MKLTTLTLATLTTLSIATQAQAQVIETSEDGILARDWYYAINMTLEEAGYLVDSWKRITKNSVFYGVYDHTIMMCADQFTDNPNYTGGVSLCREDSVWGLVLNETRELPLGFSFDEKGNIVFTMPEVLDVLGEDSCVIGGITYNEYGSWGKIENLYVLWDSQSWRVMDHSQKGYDGYGAAVLTPLTPNPCADFAQTIEIDAPEDVVQPWIDEEETEIERVERVCNDDPSTKFETQKGFESCYEYLAGLKAAEL